MPDSPAPDSDSDDYDDEDEFPVWRETTKKVPLTVQRLWSYNKAPAPTQKPSDQDERQFRRKLKSLGFSMDYIDSMRVTQYYPHADIFTCERR